MGYLNENPKKELFFRKGSAITMAVFGDASFGNEDLEEMKVDAATTLLCIGLFSLKKVTAGTELTVDDGVDFSTNFERQCGAPGCRNTNM